MSHVIAQTEFLLTSNWHVLYLIFIQNNQHWIEIGIELNQELVNLNQINLLNLCWPPALITRTSLWFTSWSHCHLYHAAFCIHNLFPLDSFNVCLLTFFPSDLPCFFLPTLALFPPAVSCLPALLAVCSKLFCFITHHTVHLASHVYLINKAIPRIHCVMSEKWL